MQQERIQWLICHYLDQDLSEAQREEFDHLILHYPALRAMLDRLTDEHALSVDLQEWASFAPDQNEAYYRKKMGLPDRHAVPGKKWKYWLMAAALVLVLAGTLLWIPRDPATNRIVEKTAVQNNDAAPGGDRATLTLDNGQAISLDTLAPGLVANQPGSRITKADSGTLSITSVKTTLAKETPLHYNTLTTPRGGQFAITLPDHTKVWLNNSSSLRFPTSFTGPVREVTLTGEAYFEVSHDPSRSFRVKVGAAAVHVLGTHFVVAAYPEEKRISTTLLEGKILLNTAAATQLMAPGEQLILYNDNSRQLLHDVDIDEAMAWKEGYFHFTHADLNTVLRQISRWYDLDVDCRISSPARIYNGEIDKHLPLSVLLNYLTKNEIHFRLEAKKLIVTR